MAASRVNLAVTKDGEAYNKLQRPDDYLISVPPDQRPSTTASPSTLHTGKRKCDQNDEPGSKRARAERNITQKLTHNKGRSRTQDSASELDARTVLPVLDGEGQLSDDDTNEAQAYLRSVRSEASAIPTLLVAPNRPKPADSGFDNGKNVTYIHTTDTPHVVYKEGTWIAVDHRYDITKEYWEEDSGDLDPQDSCHRTVLHRFRNLRNKLIDFKENDCVSPPKSTKRSGSKQDWSEAVERGFPVMDDVLQMDDSTLYVALQGCGIALSRSTTISRQQSCWVWTLLALTGDFGTLDHERISRIRELGLEAVQLGDRLRANVITSRHNDAQGSGLLGLKTECNLVSDRNEEAINAEDKSGQDAKSGNEATGSSKMVITELKDILSSAVSGQGNENVREEDLSESDAAMAMSDSEDEADGTLEQARARLLAQLGDRLVQPEPPAPGFLPLSRVEAERQRQEIRKEGPRKKPAPRATPTTSTENEAIGKGKEDAPLTECDWNTRAAIDMILTVVAECYGQRDLLEFREAW